MHEKDPIPNGIRLIIVFHTLSFVLWLIGQTVAVVAYDWVADLGLQAPREMVDLVIVEINRAIGLADTLVMLPLFVIAVVGLLQRRFYGAVFSWLVFGMTLYWPAVFWASQHFYQQAGVRYQETPIEAIVLPATLMIMAAWGSWYLATNVAYFRKDASG